MIRNALLTGAAAIALAMPANAGRTGWYIGLEGGIGSIDQTDLPFTEIDGCYEYECEYASKDIFFGGKSSSLSFDDGLAAFLTVGKALGSWRLEGELGYRENDIDRITYGGWYPSKLVVLENGFWSQPGGDLTEVTLMANVVRDFDLGGRWLFSVGAGAGVDFAELTDPWGVSDNDASFAAQGIVGLTYRLSPHWDVMANYRYLWVNDPQFTTELFDGEIDLQKQSFTIGFRYGFDDPAPPVRLAIPPALPATPSQFMIYFGFDKCEVTPAADKVLAEAASAAKSTGSARILIVGHTDTMGSAAYNQRLSLCRAHAAEANLVNKGIDAGAITTTGRGESELIVSTGDDVKEPQNRRASINLE